MFLFDLLGQISTKYNYKASKQTRNTNIFFVAHLWNIHYLLTLASLVAQRLKRLPPMRETRVRSLGQEDPLEKEMATHSSILAWRIPWMEQPGGL